jgi:filamentous hemagglutinin
VASINNRAGTIASNSKNLTLNTATLNNQQGNIVHAGSGLLNLNVTDLFNNPQGTLASLGDLNLQSGLLDNAQGQIATGTTGNLTLNSQGWLNNQSGQISAGQRLSLNSVGDVNNQQGLLQSGDTLTLASANLDNRDGTLYSTAAASVQTRKLDNRSGQMVAAGNLNIDSGWLQNDHAGLIQSAADLRIDTHHEDLSNHAAGAIISQGQLTLRAGDINNQQGGTLASVQEPLSLNAVALFNNGGLIQSGQSLDLTTLGAVVNRDGGLFSQGALTLHKQPVG